MKHGIIIVLCVLAVFPVVSQAQNVGTQRTIEELYLDQDIDVAIIRGQALSGDREMKMLALQSMRGMIERGSISPDNPAVIPVLENLATEGTRRQVRSDGAMINNFPDVRRRAAELLGEVGTREAKNILLLVVRDEPEPMVLAEAVYALGTIGINDNNDVTNHIVQMLRRHNARTIVDNNLAFATLLAIEKLAQANGGLQDPELIDTVLDIAGGPYIREVRLKAIDVIYNMRSSARQEQ
jgi:HEAT repeat protein